MKTQTSPKRSWFLRDTLTIIKRSMLHIKADPEQLLGITLQPIMFVVLFRYVFGGAIQTGGTYINFLMAGIFVQTIAFGASVTGLTIATDLTLGIMDRFRSLPMSKPAILTGTVISDVLKNMLATAVMILTGLFVGFRPEASAIQWLQIIGLLTLFSFSLSWAFAYIGLKAKSIQFVQQAGFLFLFPLTFVSNAFVPADTMPKALQYFAENQPISMLVESTRALTLNMPVGDSVWKSALWCLAIFVVFYPLAIKQFNSQSN